MRNIIGAGKAGTILLVLMILLFIMHVLILAGVLPYDMVWGGQIDDEASVVPYESAALALMLAFMFVVAIKTGYVKATRLRKAAGIGMWVVFGYFILNSVGNFASAVSLENLIFGPLSIVLALLSLRVAVER